MNTIEKALGKMGQSGPGSSGDRKSFEPGVPSGKSSKQIEIDFELMKTNGMLVPSSGRSGMAEEYRHIKRPILKNVLNDTTEHSNANLIMVTSALPGEGKTFTSCNLAMSIAMELDHTCLLVDADVARPSVFRTLGIADKRPGLVDYLIDDKVDLADMMLKTNIPKLSILPAGRQDVHATELLASDSMRRLMRDLSDRYHDRVVIFDSPPLLATSEAKVLATLVGQVVVVVEAWKTQQFLLKLALDSLDKTKIAGLVLNKNRKPESHSYYYYGYGNE